MSRIGNILLFVSISIPLLLLALYLLVFLPQTVNHSSLPESLVLYQEYLNNTYCRHAYPIHKKPLDIISPNRPKQPLKLAIVPRTQNESKKSFFKQYTSAFKGNVENQIEIEEIGLIPGDKPVAHFVLIEGAPGIGKSTLCWQLCRLWAEGKLQHKWDLMVLVEIRHETMQKARSVYDLLYHPNNKTRELIANEVKEQDGKGLLLIFDGYDELSEAQRSELSVFQLILTNQLLYNATIVVTSRPTATSSLPSQFVQDLDQHIAIAGFDKETIHTYIRSACGGNINLSEDFHTYVSTQPFIFSVMYNPLHCTIVTELYIQYWQDGPKGFAPNTLTELYTSLVLNLVRRNLACNVWHMSDLPANVNNSLMKLAELAARGLKEEKYVFNSVPNGMLSLGLMVPVRQIYDLRASQPTYIFLHLTLQEYLSAHYLSQQRLRDDFLPKQGNIFCPMYMENCAGIVSANDDKPNDYHKFVHWPHFLFLAGLTKLGHPFPFELIPKETYLYVSYVISLCQLSFEAQSPQILSTMLSNRQVEIINRDYDALPLFLLGYCIAHSDSTTIWIITNRNEYIRIEMGHPLLLISETNICTYYSMISDGLFYSLNTTDRNARPSVHLQIPVKCLLQNISWIHLLTSVTLKLYISYDQKLNSSEGLSLLQSLSYFFPRLVSLQLPKLSCILTDSPQLPQSLVSIRNLTLPHYKVLLDNLHEYPALEDLEIHAHMYQDWPISFCPPQKTDENSLQVENNDCLLLERKLHKLAHKLKTFTLSDVHVDHSCVHGIAHLLNTSLNNLTLHNCMISSTDFDSITTVIATSKLKHLEIIYSWSSSFGINRNVKGQSLTKLLIQSKTLEEVMVKISSEYTNSCDVVRFLVEAMAHSSVKKLIVETIDFCDVSDIHYDRYRVKVSSVIR